ncbi:hypothetical protein C8J57DRAFT_1259372 [Mycena rebaudengoi]|nr:hypothetical protein C8J57DRAFT_1259372 [Mycena rebaudengoi]
MNNNRTNPDDRPIPSATPSFRYQITPELLLAPAQQILANDAPFQLALNDNSQHSQQFPTTQQDNQLPFHDTSATGNRGWDPGMHSPYRPHTSQQHSHQHRITSVNEEGNMKITLFLKENEPPSPACRVEARRKIRCCTSTPTCNNCVKKSLTCKYDQFKKKRGPDKAIRRKSKKGAAGIQRTNSQIPPAATSGLEQHRILSKYAAVSPCTLVFRFKSFLPSWPIIPREKRLKTALPSRSITAKKKTRSRGRSWFWTRFMQTGMGDSLEEGKYQARTRTHLAKEVNF